MPRQTKNCEPALLGSELRAWLGLALALGLGLALALGLGLGLGEWASAFVIDNKH